MWSTSYQTPRTSTHRYLFLWADKLKITPFSGYITRTISRDRSQNLRYDIASLESQEPVLLADGDIMETERFHSKLKLDAGMGQPVSWDNYSAGRLLQVLWSRLVFLFPVS
ncbi:unnamed protein product [Aspergillus oryzae]|uniref:Unnamed protein product n=1 Tax=Aspergillus oryzae var. brunneus TaxID=332754 RepID=A0ABQ6LEL4_ASPOZ|nr:unnamed protein product [Aspergillus oryzae]GMF91909.1 unnamed protein product [Aspergillus oryzae]GMG10725.1 unnamed protein product [Aspergillus oryzae]GMG55099.1 unnamed protein product [Aspergillus oryzae var. brunneus]